MLTRNIARYLLSSEEGFMLIGDEGYYVVKIWGVYALPQGRRPPNMGGRYIRWCVWWWEQVGGLDAQCALHVQEQWLFHAQPLDGFDA